jgi:predicted GIY-YIG superfamily endonuclease
MTAYVYIVRCRDGRYYVGSTRDSLDRRISEHNSGHYGGYTSSRLPVELVYHEFFDRITDAIAAERKLKGWSRAKKEALIKGDFERLKKLSKRRGNPTPS